MEATMSLDLYDKEQILAVLQGLYVAQLPKPEDGFCQALIAVAVAFRAIQISAERPTSENARRLLGIRAVQ
jgi:hypothetical protein